MNTFVYYNRDEPLSTFIYSVHEAMKTEFQYQKEEEKAKELQDFFQILKKRINELSQVKEDDLNQVLKYEGIDLIIRGILEIHPRLQYKVRFLSNFFSTFGRIGGFNFEKNLGDVMASISNQIDKSNSYQSKQFVIGGDNEYTVEGFSLEDLGKMPDSMAEVLMKETVETTNKYFENIINKNLVKDKNEWYYITKMGKTDIKGLEGTVEIDVNVIANSSLKKYYNLLKDATFSAKNYSSRSKKGEDLDEISPNLHLGNSNPYKGYAGTLSLIASHKTILATFYRSYYHYTYGYPDKKQVGQFIYKMRFIFELTGVGILKKTGNGYILQPRVKYLIYNDPASDGIWVASAAKLISDLLNSNEEILSNPFGAIKIAKNRVKHSHN